MINLKCQCDLSRKACSTSGGGRLRGEPGSFCINVDRWTDFCHCQTKHLLFEKKRRALLGHAVALVMRRLLFLCFSCRGRLPLWLPEGRRTRCVYDSVSCKCFAPNIHMVTPRHGLLAGLFCRAVKPMIWEGQQAGNGLVYDRVVESMSFSRAVCLITRCNCRQVT